MIQDENDPVLMMELAGLTEGLNSWLGEDLDPEALDTLYEFIEEHRKNAYKKGVKFPKLSVLVIPRLGWIKIVREDLTPINIRRAVLALLRECPSVTREEVSIAVKRTWPYMGTSTIIDEAEVKIENPQKRIEFNA